MKREGRERLARGRVVVLACALGAVAALAAPARDDASGARPPQASGYEMPAAATLDPGSVDFGKQVIGRLSRAQRVVVTNTGGAPLLVHSAVVAGDAPDRYSVVNDTCTGAEVVPYRACVIDITFAPAGRDDFEAELKLTHNAPESPQTIRITGEGINSINVPPGTIP